jgi:hypothetical protein
LARIFEHNQTKWAFAPHAKSALEPALNVSETNETFLLNSRKTAETERMQIGRVTGFHPVEFRSAYVNARNASRDDPSWTTRHRLDGALGKDERWATERDDTKAEW